MAAEITNQCANLTLADVEDDDVAMQVPNVPKNQPDSEEGYYVVGRLVTQKPIRFPFFQDTMAAVWRPAMGVNTRQLESRRYLFRFYHEADVERVINVGPWTYEQSLLIMKRLDLGEDPYAMALDQAEFWVQVHSLPAGFRSEIVVKAIGSFLGTLIHVDDRNFDGSMRLFYRVRVAIDVAKPLKKQMKLKKDNGSWVYVDFRYERLPTFCFLCGVIGHGEKFCSKIVHGADLKAEKPYGVWMRAGSRKGVPNSRQQWIPSETTIERRNWRSPTMEADAILATAEPEGNGKGSEDDGVPSARISEQKRRRTTDIESELMEVEAGVSKTGKRRDLRSKPTQTYEFIIMELSGAWQLDDSSCSGGLGSLKEAKGTFSYGNLC
ncbi:PREDICTED: uncharacterized protein LOC109174453 [Ipomoea nil]|uniref:uncharacterized protein LOC109174453 n=1 Tax=Ipomoea nil TaxID=35883 RepID=UPI0009018A59|nr:PREDICTED: uncharacterized protein LOC109174453 [Ipomoea nil]